MKNAKRLGLVGLVAVAVAAGAATTAAAVPEGYAVTPFGLFPAECVHAVPDGSRVETVEEGRAMMVNGRRVASCASALPALHSNPRVRRAGSADDDGDEGDGWQAYVEQKIVASNSSVITSFNGQWTVPPTPAEEAQTLFSFTGVQNIDWVPPQPDPMGPFDILQPVLQYGYSSAGGGAYWSIASWYVTLGSDVVYSELKKIPASGTIVGLMERVQGSPDEWFVATIHQESGISSNVTLSRPLLAHQPFAYVTMEVYDVDDCGQYPAAGSVSSFTDLAVEVDGQPFTPTWQVGTQGQNPPVCGSAVKINSPSAVDLIY